MLFDNFKIKIIYNCCSNILKDIKTRKITGIINELFIPLGLKPKYFYEYHFGVLGIGETLVIGNMAVY